MSSVTVILVKDNTIQYKSLPYKEALRMLNSKTFALENTQNMDEGYLLIDCMTKTVIDSQFAFQQRDTKGFEKWNWMKLW